MGSADKKARKKRTRKMTKPNPSTSLNSQISLSKSEQEEIRELENMMDAETDSDPPPSSVSKGRNPYLTDTCLLCRCKRPESCELSIEETNGSVNQIPLWVCNDCRKTVEEEEKKSATTMASLLVSMEEELKLDSGSLPSLEPVVSWSSSGSGSEPTTPNGTICNCEACAERRQIESEEEKESAELMKVWQELRHVVRCIYREAGTALAQSNDADSTSGHSDIDTNKCKQLVHRLVTKDAHQLFQRLESQGREYVIEMKVRLLKQLTAGHKTPAQAKQFVAMLLEEYSQLSAAAKTLAAFLTELMDHLKRFNLTWELHNKHLFQSIIYTDPVVQNSLPMLITQLRLGAASKESYHEDTYPNILHRYLKFDDEMSVISVVWRECEQLIENYNDEQTALKAKQKMLKEDWEFFKAQRKLLEEKVLSTTHTTSVTPSASLAANNNDSLHLLEEQLSETMRNIFKGTKAGDDCLCPNCNRKRCPCDECSISHMITCGIINPQVSGDSVTPSSDTHPLSHTSHAHSLHHSHLHPYPHTPSPLHGMSSLHTSLHTSLHHTVTTPSIMTSSYSHDPRYVIDVTPPSMSSTSDSSDGSESPITVHPDRLNTYPFENSNFSLTDEIEEIPEELEIGKSCDGSRGDIDSDDDSTDEGDEGEGCERDSPASPTPSGERQQGDGQERDDSAIETESTPIQQPCDCTHCTEEKEKAIDAQILKMTSEKQCQCHACLQQSGQGVTTSLPHQLPMSPRPAAFHLYPHIHGTQPSHLTDIGHNVMRRSVLQPHLYELHGMTSTVSTSTSSQSHNNPTSYGDISASATQLSNTSFIPPPPTRKSDLDTTWDWDPTSKLLFGGQKYGGTIGSELFNVPTPPLLTGNPFMGGDLGSASGVLGVDNSLANLMKTSTVLQQCVSASKPLTTTTVTTSTGITTSITGLKQDSLNDAFTDAHNKILKVSKALLKQQQQKQQNNTNRSGSGNSGGAHTNVTPTVSQPVSSCTQSTLPMPTSTAFTFGLPASPNKNKVQSSPPSAGLGAFSGSSSIGMSLPFAAAAASSLQQSVLNSGGLGGAGVGGGGSLGLGGSSVDFCFKHPFTSPTSAFSCPPPPPPSAQQLSPTNLNMASMASQQMASPPVMSPISSVSAQSQNNGNHQVKLNPDFIRAAAALQKAISEQSAAQNSGITPNFNAFQNPILQNLPQPPQPSLNLLTTCTHGLTHNTGGGVMQVAGSSALQSSATSNPLGMAATSLKHPANHHPINHHQPVNNHHHLMGGECENSHCDGDDDSIDDSCSEKSSSTSTSNNQKDGKYCDCCYCEFFGHTTPPTVPQSRNLEMRERLRKRLKNRNEQKQSQEGLEQCEKAKNSIGTACRKVSEQEPIVLPQAPPTVPPIQPLPVEDEKSTFGDKDVDELLKYINGGEEDGAEKKSSKAAKRARQKQRKAEEKARKEEQAQKEKEQQERIQAAKNQIAEFNEQAKKLQADLNRSRAKEKQNQGGNDQQTLSTQEQQSRSSPKSSSPSSTSKDSSKQVLAQQQNSKPDQQRRHSKENGNKTTQAQKSESQKLSTPAISEQKSEGKNVLKPIAKVDIALSQGKKKGKQKEKIVDNTSKNILSAQQMSDTNANNAKTNNNSVKSKADKNSKVSQDAKLNNGQVAAQRNAASSQDSVKIESSNKQVKTSRVVVDNNKNVSMAGKSHNNQNGNTNSTITVTSTKNTTPPTKNVIASSKEMTSSKNITSASMPTISPGTSLSVKTTNLENLDFGAKPLLNGEIPSNVSTSSINRVKVKRGPKSAVTKSPRPGSGQKDISRSGMLPSPPPPLILDGNVSSATQAIANLNINLPAQPPGEIKVQTVCNSTANNKKKAITNVVLDKNKADNLVNVNNQANVQLNQQVQPTADWANVKSSPTPLNLPPNMAVMNPNHLRNVSTKAMNEATQSIAAKPVRMNRPILHAARTLQNRQRTPLSSTNNTGNVGMGGAKSLLQMPMTTTSGNLTNMPIRIPLPLGTSSAPATPDQSSQRRGSGTSGHHNIAPRSETSVQLNFEQRSVPSTPTKQKPGSNINNNGANGQGKVSIQGKSRSEGSLSNSAPTTPRKDEQSSGRSKKNKKKSKNDELTSVDEIFLPKEDNDLHPGMDDFDREIEEFKRFCLDSTPVGKREKIQVNVNLKDIFSKKKGNVAY